MSREPYSLQQNTQLIRVTVAPTNKTYVLPQLFDFAPRKNSDIEIIKITIRGKHFMTCRVEAQLCIWSSKHHKTKLAHNQNKLRLEKPYIVGFQATQSKLFTTTQDGRRLEILGVGCKYCALLMWQKQRRQSPQLRGYRALDRRIWFRRWKKKYIKNWFSHDAVPM